MPTVDLALPLLLAGGLGAAIGIERERRRMRLRRSDTRPDRPAERYFEGRQERDTWAVSPLLAQRRPLDFCKSGRPAASQAPMITEAVAVIDSLRRRSRSGRTLEKNAS